MCFFKDCQEAEDKVEIVGSIWVLLTHFIWSQCFLTLDSIKYFCVFIDDSKDFWSSRIMLIPIMLIYTYLFLPGMHVLCRNPKF